MITDKTEALACGVEPDVLSLIVSIFGENNVAKVMSYDDLAKVLETEPGTRTFTLVCGGRIPEITPNELAQSLRITFVTSDVYFASAERQHYDKATLRKNGFMESFLLPLDRDRLKKTVEEAKARTTASRLFRPMCLFDVQAGETLDFDTFLHLPFNNKFLRYTAAGDSIDSERLERLKTKEVKSLHVAHTDVERVYAHASARLRKLLPGTDSPVGETERRVRLESSVRDLVTDMFETTAQSASVNEGKVIKSSAQEICRQLYVDSGANATWYDKFSRIAVESGDDYSHFTSVATYAVLFSLGLRIGNQDELALAGLLHDLGMVELPREITDKSPEQRTPQEDELYKQHPEISLRLIKERKIILPTSIHDIILQHHERWDGLGYPKKLVELRINPGALVLALADQFDYETRVQAGKKRVSPLEILQKFRAENRFPPKFIENAIRLFSA